MRSWFARNVVVFTVVLLRAPAQFLKRASVREAHVYRALSVGDRSTAAKCNNGYVRVRCTDNRFGKLPANAKQSAVDSYTETATHAPVLSLHFY